MSTRGASRVCLVTDSTAYLPAGVADDIVVVPLQVVLGLRTGADGVDVSPAEVAAALVERRVSVSTSRPTPADFASTYRACGATRILSVHLSGALSGTLDTARLAAAQVGDDGIEVRVVDSGTIAMGLGFAVLAAAAAASNGADLDAVEAVALLTASRTTTLFYVDSLEYLRRGGRIGAAAALVGTALAVKPLLHVTQGRIAPLEKVRTASKALARMEDLAVLCADEGPVDLAVHHLAAAEKAAAFAGRLRGRVVGLQSLHVCEVGAVVGAHVGPGLLGVVVSQR